MTVVVLGTGYIKDDEMPKLSLAQIMILSAIRQLKSTRRVADFFQKDITSIHMILMRIRKKGIEV